MSLNIIIQQDAENDINSIFDWYEEQRSGLGREFAQELSASTDSILDAPPLYSEQYRGIRRALLRRFPIGIYYLLNEDRIVVLAVLHLAMEPDKWKNRS